MNVEIDEKVLLDRRKSESTGGAEPLVSIVIPTRNSAALLPAAMDSLAAQTFRDFEVIVCDGLSTDDTVALAKSYGDRVPRLTVVSEKDGGVYQGINRGVALASGRWVYILGSDDSLAGSDVLFRLSAVLLAASEWMVYGDVQMNAPNPWVPVGGRYAGKVSYEALLSDNICQQAIFYRRAAFSEIGLFRAQYRICADWDFALRLASKFPTRWVDLVISEYSATGLSSNVRDERFHADLPDILASIVLSQPLNVRLTVMRWKLFTLARAAKRQGFLVRAIKLYGVGLWLAMCHRFPGNRARMDS